MCDQNLMTLARLLRFSAALLMCGAALGACLRVETPVYNGQCGPWRERRLPSPEDVQGPTIYFMGQSSGMLSADRAGQLATANALQGFAHWCDVAVNSELFIEKFETTRDVSTELQVTSKSQLSIASSVRLVGVWTEMQCQKSETTKEGTTYDVWTLLSAPRGSKASNCTALQMLAATAGAMPPMHNPEGH